MKDKQSVATIKKGGFVVVIAVATTGDGRVSKSAGKILASSAERLAKLVDEWMADSLDHSHVVEVAVGKEPKLSASRTTRPATAVRKPIASIASPSKNSPKPVAPKRSPAAKVAPSPTSKKGSVPKAGNRRARPDFETG